jgi:hypothetical protein
LKSISSFRIFNALKGIVDMGKIYDLEEERQKAKDRVQAPPPLFRLVSKDGRLVVYPKMEKGPDGKWHIMHLEDIKAMLGYGREETDNEEDTKED